MTSSVEPSGAMRPLTPTVDTWATARPCSMARIRLIANCCSASAENPNVALFVWTMRSDGTPPASARTSRMSESYATSKQIVGTAA